VEKRGGGGDEAEESVRRAKKQSITALSEADEVAMTAPDPANSPLTICLFGPFRVLQEGVPLPPLRSRKGHWLLALLILRRQAEVERTWLAGTLWPDSSEEQALSSLRTSLKDLRRALGPEKDRLHSPTPHTLSLELDGAAVDLVAFDAALARRDPAALEEAITLYQGPLLEGWDQEWIFPAREAREQEYVRALETLATAALTTGDPALAERYLRRIIAVDPLQESAHRRLMEAQAAGRNYAAATQTYRELRLLLHQELNAAPAPETTALYQEIRESARRSPEPLPHSPLAALAEAPAPGHPSVHAAARQPLPPLGLPVTPPNNLPLQPTRFIGREQAIADVKRLLAEAPLVTLTGAGGVGKTRLALQVAAELLEEYRDGVWVVELASVTAPTSGYPALVPQVVAASLEVREEPGRSLTLTLLDFLRTRCLLLVLDNCEHLLEVCASLVNALLRGCPAVRVIATSQARLGIAGEQRYRVPSLSLPTLQREPAVERLAECEAVRLFVDRARLVEATFALTESNAPAVAEICRRLDGIPLALELAAAWTGVLPVEQIQARLDDRFRLLTRGSRTVLPRHQTLHASIDWSYDQLPDGERALLHRVSVFAGGFTWEAAEAIGAGEEIEAAAILDLLAQLVDKSLVIAEMRGREVRYTLLETLREYGLERLKQSGEDERIRGRHAEFFRGIVERHEDEETVWLDRLEQEQGNLRAAAAWIVQHSEPETWFRLGTALSRFWQLRGYWAEGRERLAELLALPAPPSEARAMLLRQAGQLAMLQADYPAARSRLEQSLALYRDLGNTEDLPSPLNALGEVARNQGDYRTACRYFEESLGLCRAHGNKDNIAWALQALGEVARERGDAAARPLVEESLTLFREEGDRRGISYSLRDLGALAEVEGNLPLARTLHEQSLAIRRELGHKGGVAGSLGRLGEVCAGQGEYEKAAALYQESLALQRELGNRRGIATCLEGFAGLAARWGENARRTGTEGGTAFGNPPACYERAARWFGAAEALRERLGAPLPPAERVGYERLVALVRERLPAAWAAAWQEGRAAPVEQAINEALRSVGGDIE
jgi:non-specific serine/threonine protein kinase